MRREVRGIQGTGELTVGLVATLPGADLALALELANTFSLQRGRAIDGLAAPRDVAAWLAARQDRLGGPGAGDLSAADVRALRELLQTGLAAAASGRRPADAFIRHLNRLSRGAPRYVELHWPRGADPGVHVRVRSRTPGATALAAVAHSAIELLGGPGRNRLRRCGGPRCVLFFLASDPRQTWCSGACGNRARMARYQAARRARRAGLAATRNPLASGQLQEERLLRRRARPRTGTMSKGSRSSPTRKR